MSWTKNCLWCGEEMLEKRKGKKQFCSSSCRQQQWQVSKDVGRIEQLSRLDQLEKELSVLKVRVEVLEKRKK